jgi:hypothetical protein
MGRVFAEIDDTLAAFIRAQHVFFVATAPLDAGGHINVSPKGLGSLAILDRCTVAYLDLTGSGVETIAHLRENGRITILFSAFDGPPKTLRLYGRGRVVPTEDAEFATLAGHFPTMPGARSIIVVALDRIADSCGFSTPRYQYEGERPQLVDWADRKGPEGVVAYRAERNAASIDGLPGLPLVGERRRE